MSVRGHAPGNGMGRTTQKPPGTAFTMMGWFYGYDFITTRGHLLTYEAGDAGAPRRLRVEQDETLNLFAGGGAVGGSFIATNQWFHVALTYNGTTNNVYLNGVLDITADFPTAPEGALYVGNDPEIEGDQSLNGRWSAIKIWNAVLPVDDIRLEMGQYLPARRSQLNTFSPCLTVEDAPKNFVQQGTFRRLRQRDVARRAGEGQARWVLDGEVVAEAPLVNTLVTEDDPPLRWGTVPRRQAPRRASAAGDTTLTVSPARLTWQAQAPRIPRPQAALVFTPGRLLRTPRLRYPLPSGMDRTHPLNQGLLAWYLTQPWMFPGGRLYDLAEGYPGTWGTAGGSDEDSGWGATTRPHGRGELRFDGVTDVVNLQPIPMPSNVWTVAFWMHPRAPAPEYGGLLVDNNNFGLYYNQDTINLFEGISHRATTLLIADTWTHVVVVSVGTSARFYFNGVSVGNTVPYFVGTPTWKFIGSDEQATAYRGLLDDLRVYSRALSVEDVGALFTLSCQGNRDLLRAPRRLWALGGNPPTDRTVLLTPVQMPWRASVSIPSGEAVIRPRSLVLYTKGRRLAQPRLRFPSVLGSNEVHVLNQGLVAWYMAQPWMFPGTRWDELVNGYDGTLTNMAAGSVPSGWGSTTRPGGRAEVRFNGLTNAVTIPPLAMGGNVFTVALWLHPMVPQNNEFGALIVESNTKGLFYNQSTMNYYELVGESGSHRPGQPIADNAWTHIALVSTGTELQFYFNGTFQEAITFAAAPVTWTMIGNDELNTAFQGYLDDIRIYNRALNALDMASLYAATYTGSRELLQYPRTLFVLGGDAGLRVAQPAQVRWAAQALRFDVRKALIPAQMPWRAQARTVRQVIPPLTTILAGMRRLVQPRIRALPGRDLTHAETERRGLLLWYLAQPWQFAGRTWTDLITGKPGEWQGIATGNAVAGWQAGTHPGGRGAMGFDGSTTAITVEADEPTSSLTQMTLCAWVYPRSFGTTGKVRILDKMGIDGIGGWSLGLSTVETVTRAMELHVDGTLLMTAYSQDAAIDVLTWSHLTVVWTGSFQRSEVAFYLNGTPLATGTAGQDGQGPPRTETNGLVIGNRDALDRGFDGWLDDLRIYSKALSSAEVTMLYQESLRGSPRLLQRPQMPMFFGGIAPTNVPTLVIPTPSRMMWRAQTPFLTQAGIVSPARLQWQAAVLVVQARALAQPARLQWRASRPTIPGFLAMVPARLQWQARAGVVSLPRGGLPPSPIIFPILRHWTAKPPLGTPLRTDAEASTHLLLTCLVMNEGQGDRLADGMGRRVVTLGVGAGEPTHARWDTARIQGRSGPVLTLLGDAGPLPQTSANLDPPLTIPAQQAVTIELWLKRTVGPSVDQVLMTSTGSTFSRLITRETSSTTFVMQWNDPILGTRTYATPIPMDQWQHIVLVTADSPLAVGQSRTQRLYLDGMLVEEATVGVSLMNFGRLFNDGSATPQTFTGSIGLLRVWGRALRDDDIGRLYAEPYAMFAPPTMALFVARRPAVPPVQMRWAVQALVHANRALLLEPAHVQWAAQRTAFVGQLTGGIQPARMPWRAMSVQRSINVQPAHLTWKAHQQRLPIGLNLRDCGDVYEAALQKTMIGGDWLIQAPDIGLKVSCNYEGGGGWEHRIIDISDIEISAPPGGGIASAANVTVTIAENQTGQSILQLWEQASAVESVEVTIDFLLNGETSALRIFTGRIDSIVVKDALAQLLLVDDSISRNLLVPREVVTIEDFPNADQAVLTKAMPLVYGQGSVIGACPLLFVDLSTNTYLVANHPMLLGGKLAVYDQPTKTFLTLDTIVFIPNNGTASISLGTLNNHTFQVADFGASVDAGLAIDGNSTTVTTVGTPYAFPGYDSAIQLGDGWGYARWRLGAPATPLTTTLKVDITNHRRAPGSDPTTTGKFFLRTVDAGSPSTIQSRVFYVSPTFNHVTSAQNNTFILSNINIGINEIFDVLLITRCQGTIGNASQVYQVGEVSLTPLVAFSANISGTPTAIGVPINIQELRFNVQRPVLSVYFASSVTSPTNVIDGNSLTLARIGTTGVDSNLDGIGELIITTDVTSAQRANNTVAIDLARHRRSLSSTPTVTGTFAIQTYNTNTGVLLRDNLFVTQAFRHQLNPISTSYVATAINLGATAQLAVRVLARNEGSVGSAGQTYDVGEISVETFYQPRGDSGEVFLFGTGYEGRTDPDGSVTTYIGTTPGRLFQTPDMVIASIYVQELGLSIDLPSFATAYNYFAVNMLRFDGGIGAGWAIEQANARDVLDALGRESASILFPTFAATWGIRPFRADTAVHQEFTASNILTEYGSESQRAEDRRSTVQITLGNLQNVYNHFEVRYKYNVGSRKYDSAWKVTKNGSNLPSSDTDKAEIEETCLKSFLRYGDLEPRIIEANWIADDTTAAHLLKHLVRYFAQQRITVQFETTFKAACLQVGDFITITDTMLPSGDNGGTFEVHTIRYMPMRGRIQLVTSRVSQIPDVIIPDPPVAATGCARFATSPGFKACWDFEEVSGTRTDHITGVELSEVNGPILGVTGKVGQAIRLVRSSSQYLSNPQALIGAMTGSFTVACWVRLQSLPGEFWAIASNTDPQGNSSTREFFLGITPGFALVTLRCGLNDTGGTITSVSPLPFTGSSADWTLIRAWRSIDSTYAGSISIQINNGVVTTGTFSGSSIPFAYNGFLLGAAVTTGGTIARFADIDLDQFQVWNRVLNQAELDAIWNGGMG